jgi:hypothetical protein
MGTDGFVGALFVCLTRGRLGTAVLFSYTEDIL